MHKLFTVSLRMDKPGFPSAVPIQRAAAGVSGPPVFYLLENHESSNGSVKVKGPGTEIEVPKNGRTTLVLSASHSWDVELASKVEEAEVSLTFLGFVS